MQNEYMAKDAAMTVRVSAALKRRLELRARAGRRSLSAQVLHDLSGATDPPTGPGGAGRFLGRFAGSTVPREEDFQEVRGLLWGRLRSARRDA